MAFDNSGKISHTVDCRGMHCPLPVAMLKLGLQKISAGEFLELIGTDYASQKDIPAAVGSMNAELVQNIAEKKIVNIKGAKFDKEFHYIVKKLK